jgi:pyruvate dehydrogenase E2 component (dihydrolipoyllysine-residue acetyltransferase)
MATPVEAPKLGNTVEECIVAKWRKQKGEAVSTGDVILDIETDKATFEVSSPVDGILLETFFEEGALVPVFTNLFVVGAQGESVDEFRPGNPPPVSEKTASATLDTVRVPLPAAPTFSGAISPRAQRFAEEHNFHPTSIAGSGPGGRVLEEDIRNAYYSSPRVSSAAKKQLQKGTEIRGEGSGTAGMILSSDLGPAASRISNIREKIARRMRESLASTAQYTLNASADASGMLTLRARVKASTGVPDININDMVSFCTVKALLQIPDLNAEFIDGKIYKHSEVHLGFATDTSRGLIVPVVRDAHKLTIGELATQMKALAAQAVQGTVSADTLSGATFTISNLGGLGIESFTPLLNPPQVAILGVGAIQIKPVRKQGKLEFIDAIGLSLTCDHQVVDGAPGARFLQVLKDKIENVESLCTI